MLKLLVTSCLLILIAGQDDINTSTFPEDFLFGTATSAYQIEGSWKADGKGENNWDRFIRTDPNSVIDNSTADIACDSYHKYREDVEQLKTIGAQFYRFSLSWSRILPNGFTNEINQKGVAYYKSLIKELKSNGIIPFVTLHHFDTPQPLEDLGGWTDEQIVQRYSEYARLCFRLFGDDVKHWLTINEPKQLCYMGYGLGLLAPGTRSPGAGEYECDRNVVLAHAGACKIYREEFRAEQQGEIGMVIDTPWFQPANASSPGDIEASERQLQFTYGLYANPIVYGDYPEVVKEVVLRRSLAQNYTASRLRGFTEEQKAALKGSYDFLCLNYYTSYMVQEDPEVDPEGKGYQSDPETDIYFDPDWESTVSEVFKVVPWGVRKVLRWMRETYGNPAIYVTENGYPSDGTIDDQKRIRFIKFQHKIPSQCSSGYSYSSVPPPVYRKSDDEINNTTFPEYFLFGTASSAYQIEGAWNTYGKGENIWDRFTHVNASLIPGNANADVACDSYHRYKEDVQQLKTIGSQVYRFSLSWSRILPNGLPDVINQQGVDYYRRLIAELKANDVVPYVTLFHFDTPQRLEEMGGWTNSSVVEWFGDYARLAFGLFGDDVKHWMTVNEPKQTCHLGYGTGYFPPGVRSPGVGEYACVKNTILAHAAAWRIYHKEFRPTQKGELGIVIDSQWYEPVNPSSPADQRASEMGLNFAYGLYAYPLVYGDFPPMVKKLVRKRSLAQGYRRSRLPEFSARERMRIKGAYDFFGLNYYSALMVRADPNPDPDAKGYDADSEIQTYLNMTWENTSKDKQKIVPWGIRKVLYWMKKTLKDPKIVITENGMPDLGDLDDTLRIKYIKLHLSSVKDSIEKDGVNVRGYIYWTLMDNFELRAGYSLKFGLYKVDFDTQDRTPKSSAEYFRKVIETRCLVEKCVESNSDK